jgi:coenzyme F420-0:L-glutamate ligase/coenzyme F420-1:gamma-L-glutamate ligase
LARPTPVVILPVKFPIIRQGQNLSDVVAKALIGQNIRLKNGDVLTVASKVVGICENRVLRLGAVRVTGRAKELAKKLGIDERLASIVLDEADLVLGGVRGFLLTVKDGILTANAGVDLKNSPPGTATLWPKNAGESARRLRRNLLRKGTTHLGVEIVDSRVTPLRLGTVGLAIGVSGFEPVLDDREKPDLYGRRVRITQSNIADDLAAAAHMLMGETNQRVGAVVIREAPVRFHGMKSLSRLKLKPQQCLIFGSGGMGRFR